MARPTLLVLALLASAPLCALAQEPGTQASNKEQHIGNGVSAPVVLVAQPPQYSEEARTKNITGSVLVNLQVDETGNPVNVRILRSLGSGLDEKALEAVRAYHFKPAMKDNQPVTVQLNIEVNFQIYNKPPA